jgi:hypothetical protein
MVGLDICRLHGGSAPQNRRKGAEIKAQRRAKGDLNREMKKLGLLGTTSDDEAVDPRDALAEELVRSHRVVAAL